MKAELVKLTKEQADALERTLENHYSGNKAQLVKSHVSFAPPNLQTSTNWGGTYVALNDLSVDTLIKALYIEYEVVETKEEKLLAYYKAQKELPYMETDSATDAVYKVLNILQIKVKGIND